eukprot:TRINITY_DN5247_c0_g1_i2.p1 TRINITY_DN5247_c0_g1~~TRINITY_DN5247_c0_g1_i2.p1  ORF type:complete len:184 (-),score=8.44 TRINITY_DN5247_c0_g1_i2:12-527(-)
MYGDFVSRINRRIRVLIIVLICCLCMPFASCDQQDTLIGELTPIPSDLYNCTMTTECMLIKEQCNNDDCPRLNPVGVRIDGTAVNTKYSDFQWGGVCTRGGDGRGASSLFLFLFLFLFLNAVFPFSLCLYFLSDILPLSLCLYLRLAAFLFSIPIPFALHIFKHVFLYIAM